MASNKSVTFDEKITPAEGSVTKIFTVTEEDGKKEGSYTDALRGKTLYLDTELFNKASTKSGCYQ